MLTAKYVAWKRFGWKGHSPSVFIKVAERLFRQIGFEKTTVADIARELHMSPANVYRYFAAKSEINEAVCMDLLGTIEDEAEEIAASRDTATQRISNLFGSVRNTHFEQYISNRKLYDLVEASIINKCASIRQHNERMIEILEQIIASGWRPASFRLETLHLRHVSSTPLASDSLMRA